MDFWISPISQQKLEPFSFHDFFKSHTMELVMVLAIFKEILKILFFTTEGMSDQKISIFLWTNDNKGILL